MAESTRACCVERSCGNYDARATIDHLHAAIERMRTAGDNLIAALDLVGIVGQSIKMELVAEAIQSWKETSRG